MVFRRLYEWVVRLARHPNAAWCLCGVSFCESWFFPIPTAAMLALMCLADRAGAWRLALIATLSSVLGGVVGYLVGMFLYDALGQDIVRLLRAEEEFDLALEWFGRYGAWAVLVAGVSPIPYKIFTLSSGWFGLAIVPFVAASLVGRAGQFYLVAALLYFGGPRIEKQLRRYVEWVGWGVVALAAVAYLVASR